MNYELAKKLKDAGFHYSEYWIDNESSDCFISAAGEVQPTLSELIEACGENLKNLEQVGIDKEKVWVAYSNEIPNELGVRAKIWKQGQTPEVAVAKLWLELTRPK